MKTFIIGDIHGCSGALRLILAKLSPDPDTDRLILLGDLFDRGPDSWGVYYFVRELAEKYLETLSHTTLHQAWARRYRQYLDDREALARDPEYRLLAPLQDYEEKRWMPSDNAAANVLLFYQYVPGNSPEMQTWNRAAEKMLRP